MSHSIDLFQVRLSPQNLTRATDPIHTGDGTWSQRTPTSAGGRKVLLPVRCPWREGRHVVVLRDLWNGAFYNGIQAGNIAARIGGTVYFVPENTHFGTVRP